MNKINATAVFDIGKTNKKFFLFDEDYREVHREYTCLDEIEDEDGHPTEDLNALQGWLKERFQEILRSEKFNITAINFSTYGASFVHLDAQGQAIAPLYNYTKPFPEEIQSMFYEAYGDPLEFSSETGAPQLGMLNSGMQLYWLKKKHPAIFKKIKYSLHFPQYLSYLFTGIPVSDYTSVGCHSALWSYKNKRYHDWVYKEGAIEKLAPIVSTQTSVNMEYLDKKMKIGVGIHDTSSALLPYLLSEQKPFLLISTGTWSVSLNPFETKRLTRDELENNCLNYMKIDGSPVKSVQFFMGNEYRTQIQRLENFYGKSQGYHRDIRFDQDIYKSLIQKDETHFNFESIKIEHEKARQTDLTAFPDFETAFHQLMIELMRLQVKTTRIALGDSGIKKIYIDGGFINNDIFVKLIAYHFKDFKVQTSAAPLGSSLGAAMVISDKKLRSNFLKENYKLEKLTPLMI